MNKNGVGCWNTEKQFNEENTPVVFSDCNILEFPNDIKVTGGSRCNRLEGPPMYNVAIVCIRFEEPKMWVPNLFTFISQVDQEGNLWILSDRQSRFLYDAIDLDQVNFRVLTAPVASFIQGTPCEKQSALVKAFSFMKRPKSAKSCTKIK